MKRVEVVARLMTGGMLGGHAVGVEQVTSPVSALPTILTKLARPLLLLGLHGLSHRESGCSLLGEWPWQSAKHIDRCQLLGSFIPVQACIRARSLPASDPLRLTVCIVYHACNYSSATPSSFAVLPPLHADGEPVVANHDPLTPVGSTLCWSVAFSVQCFYFRCDNLRLAQKAPTCSTY
jgi:hypothetical protein